MENISQIQLPALLREINDPPKKLYARGILPDEHRHTYITIVGSRKFTVYGKNVCEKLIGDLAGLPIVIVSGLAFGIDTLAHHYAMKYKIKTLAVLPSGLRDRDIYPAQNLPLAKNILREGGALISEYEPGFRATNWSFPRRNRIMAGISRATMIVEAGEKSGTLITAQLALDYNRSVMAVPGPVFSYQSVGCNQLIRNGAECITSGSEILDILSISQNAISAVEKDYNLSEIEKKILDNISVGKYRDEIANELKMPIHELSVYLGMLEIKGLIRDNLGMIERGV